MGAFLNDFYLVVASTLEVVVVFLAMRRRLWERLPLFFTYLVLLVPFDIVRSWVLYECGLYSRPYSLTYWLTQAALVVARGVALADFCRAALETYPGVWQLARSLLAGTAVVILALAGFRTGGADHIDSYVLFVERELEFAIVLTLLLLLVLSRYYQVAMERPLGGIAIGLLLYSTTVLITNSIVTQRLAWAGSVWEVVRRVVFQVTTAIWIYALLRPLPEMVRPDLLPQETYDQYSRQVSKHMEEVTDRLTELSKK